MAITFGFYNSFNYDRRYDATQISAIFDGIIRDGVYAALGDSLMVNEHADMTVAVGTGRAWFNHTWTYNDALLLLTLDMANALYPRYDVIYLEVNEDDESRSNSVAILKGTPASSPVIPELTNTDYVHQYPLAVIEVGAGVTEIGQDAITNMVGTDDCPFVTCPLEYISTSDLIQQWIDQWEDVLSGWTDEWETFFDAIQGVLSEEAATHLQNQIWAIVGNMEPPTISLIGLDDHNHNNYGAQIVTEGIEDGAVTAAKIENRTRKILLAPGLFRPVVADTYEVSLDVPYYISFPPDVNTRVVGTFPFPADYVVGVDIEVWLICQAEAYSSTSPSYWSLLATPFYDQRPLSATDGYFEYLSLSHTDGIVRWRQFDDDWTPDANVRQNGGCPVTIELTRLGSSGSDNNADDIRVYGVLLIYTADS